MSPADWGNINSQMFLNLVSTPVHRSTYMWTYVVGTMVLFFSPRLGVPLDTARVPLVEAGRGRRRRLAQLSEAPCAGCRAGKAAAGGVTTAATLMAGRTRNEPLGLVPNAGMNFLLWPFLAHTSLKLSKRIAIEMNGCSSIQFRDEYQFVFGVNDPCFQFWNFEAKCCFSPELIQLPTFFFVFWFFFALHCSNFPTTVCRFQKCVQRCPEFVCTHCEQVVEAV